MRFHPIVSFLLSSVTAVAASADDTTPAIAGVSANLRGSTAITEKLLDNDNDPPRSLMEMDLYGPLSCNTAASPSITSEECLANATPLSSLINSAIASSSARVIVPCGSCVTVDYTDSSTVTLPGDGSLHIKGRLHFPYESSVKLNATAIFVEGLLDIPHGINDDKEVKFSLYGSDEWYYYPHEMCTSFGDMNCMHKKSVGKKPIVVAGGTVDIRNADASCPTWTTLKDVGTIGTSPKNGQTLTKSFVLDQDFVNCVRVNDKMLITSNTYGGWDEHFELKVEAIDLASNTINMVGSTDKAFATEVSSSIDNDDEEHIFPSEVALLRRNVIFEGQRQVKKETFKIGRESDVNDLQWKSDFISSVSTDFSTSDVSNGFLMFTKTSGLGSVEL